MIGECFKEIILRKPVNSTSLSGKVPGDISLFFFFFFFSSGREETLGTSSQPMNLPSVGDFFEIFYFDRGQGMSVFYRFSANDEKCEPMRQLVLRCYVHFQNFVIP